MSATSACSFNSRLNRCSGPDFTLFGKRGRSTLVERNRASLTAETTLGREPPVSGSLQINEELSVSSIRPWFPREPQR